MYRLFSQGMNEHLAYGKKATIVSPSNITEERAAMLTDGKRGSHDYAYNWLAFSGKPLEVVIDLEETKTVRRIESAWYQYAFWLRLYPTKVEYFVSTDGNTYELAASVVNTMPIDQYGGFQRDFIGNFEAREARYIKVVAHTLGNFPEWHPGSGRAVTMLIDEIVVE